jgi:hypothetical protein
MKKLEKSSELLEVCNEWPEAREKIIAKCAILL